MTRIGVVGSKSFASTVDDAIEDERTPGLRRQGSGNPVPDVATNLLIVRTESYCAKVFGKPDARPRVIGAYSSFDGWYRLRPRPRLTPDTAAALHESNHTIVIVRWRLRRVEVLLSNYLGR
jgi:hypothetical protein